MMHTFTMQTVHEWWRNGSSKIGTFRADIFSVFFFDPLLKLIYWRHLKVFNLLPFLLDREHLSGRKTAKQFLIENFNESSVDIHLLINLCVAHESCEFPSKKTKQHISVIVYVGSANNVSLPLYLIFKYE